MHDFPSLAEGKAIPYGTYEIGDDRAVVNVGVTAGCYRSKARSSGGSCCGSALAAMAFNSR